MKPRTHDVIKRMIPPLAVWAVGKVLEVPRVKEGLSQIDETFYARTRKAERKLAGSAKNRAWFAAGAAAVAIGIGLMARATKR